MPIVGAKQVVFTAQVRKVMTIKIWNQAKAQAEVTKAVMKKLAISVRIVSSRRPMALRSPP
jgi:hypothetical protein